MRLLHHHPLPLSPAPAHRSVCPWRSSARCQRTPTRKTNRPPAVPPTPLSSPRRLHSVAPPHPPAGTKEQPKKKPPKRRSRRVSKEPRPAASADATAVRCPPSPPYAQPTAATPQPSPPPAAAGVQHPAAPSTLVPCNAKAPPALFPRTPPPPTPSSPPSTSLPPLPRSTHQPAPGRARPQCPANAP